MPRLVIRCLYIISARIAADIATSCRWDQFARPVRSLLRRDGCLEWYNARTSERKNEGARVLRITRGTASWALEQRASGRLPSSPGIRRHLGCVRFQRVVLLHPQWPSAGRGGRFTERTLRVSHVLGPGHACSTTGGASGPAFLLRRPVRSRTRL
jgi:hypothetical protein